VVSGPGTLTRRTLGVSKQGEHIDAFVGLRCVDRGIIVVALAILVKVDTIGATLSKGKQSSISQQLKLQVSTRITTSRN
jgi:hypothetical protein